ncbi:MAG: tetratricopeptide repeat protein [Bacteroidia bacterium]
MRVFLILAHILFTSLVSAGNKDSLFNIYHEKQSSDTTKLRIGIELLDELENYQYRELSKRLIQISKANDFHWYTAKIYEKSGYWYHSKNHFDSANTQYEYSIKYFESCSDTIGLALSYRNLGAIQSIYGNFPASIEYYYRSLNCLNSLNEPMIRSQIINNLAVVYFELESFEKAEKYYLECLNIRKLNGFEDRIANPLNGLAELYTLTGRTSKAFVLLRRSQSIWKKRERWSGVADVLVSIAYLHKKTGSTDSAFYYFEEAIEKVNYTNSGYDKVRVKAELGKASIYLEHNQIEKAKINAQEALKAAHALGLLNLQIDALELLYQISERLGQYKQALTYHKRLIEYKNDLLKLNDRDAVLLRDMAMSYKQKAIKDSFLEIESERRRQAQIESNLKIHNQKNKVQYSLAVLIVLLIATAIAVLTRFQISIRLAQGLIFIFFILTFEFLLVVLDPWVDNVSNGEVGWKITINTAIALILFGVHQVSERSLKKTLLNVDR